ncbi:PRC-barrel domain containing protein [bacterium]|nr:MAG: PRC-barrel domain containing protein [bacterium]
MSTRTGHTSAICARKVLGTNVYDTNGTKIGEVEDVVLDKMSNNIMFAIVSFGGFLGMAEKFHPMPWSTLDYDPEQGGYVTTATKDQLHAAPFDSIHELIKDDGMAYRDRAYSYYKAEPYWN